MCVAPRPGGGGSGGEKGGGGAEEQRCKQKKTTSINPSFVPAPMAEVVGSSGDAGAKRGGARGQVGRGRGRGRGQGRSKAEELPSMRAATAKYVGPDSKEWEIGKKYCLW